MPDSGARRIITLLTDFGTADGYVAAVKGVILGISPNASLVDLTHEVGPQDVAGAAFLLAQAAPYFPEGAIHLAVVDPGVGTDRRPLLLVTPSGVFVGPDNGIFTHCLGHVAPPSGVPVGRPYDAPAPPGVRAFRLTNGAYWRHPVSSTFHARDVFGPVAAHLSLGVRPEELGVGLSTIKCLALPTLTRDGNLIRGCVVHVDRFGNLITNIPGDELREGAVAVSIAGHRIDGLSETYAAAEGLLAVIGSASLLEVAVRDGSAASLLGVGVGEPVAVEVGGK